mmetsp:Transcript_54787/g.133986  ORF Transcript_54787/g.133986 Transcript_54787/m.133986 type:complete len:386 (-) Transcript_54787:148-1305(-)
MRQQPADVPFVLRVFCRKLLEDVDLLPACLVHRLVRTDELDRNLHVALLLIGRAHYCAVHSVPNVPHHLVAVRNDLARASLEVTLSIIPVVSIGHAHAPVHVIPLCCPLVFRKAVFLLGRIPANGCRQAKHVVLTLISICRRRCTLLSIAFFLHWCSRAPLIIAHSVPIGPRSVHGSGGGGGGGGGRSRRGGWSRGDIGALGAHPTPGSARRLGLVFCKDGLALEAQLLLLVLLILRVEVDALIHRVILLLPRGTVPPVVAPVAVPVLAPFAAFPPRAPVPVPRAILVAPVAIPVPTALAVILPGTPLPVTPTTIPVLAVAVPPVPAPAACVPVPRLVVPDPVQAITPVLLLLLLPVLLLASLTVPVAAGSVPIAVLCSVAVPAA